MKTTREQTELANWLCDLGQVALPFWASEIPQQWTLSPVRSEPAASLPCVLGRTVFRHAIKFDLPPCLQRKIFMNESPILDESVSGRSPAPPANYRLLSAMQPGALRCNCICGNRLGGNQAVCSGNRMLSQSNGRADMENEPVLWIDN